MTKAELLKIMPNIIGFFAVGVYPGVIFKDNSAWIFEGGDLNPRPITRSEILDRGGVDELSDTAMEMINAQPGAVDAIRGLKKKRISKFYSADQDRDKEGRFADEGKGNPDYLAPHEKVWVAEHRAAQAKFEKDTGKLGIRHDADLTGEPVPEKALTDYIDAVGDMQVKNLVARGMTDKVKYGGPQDFIRSEGHSFELPKEPPQVKLMTPKECYSNATSMMLRDPTKYDYAEGYYLSGHLPFPIEHAWLVDKETHEVVDPTLGWQPTARYVGVVYPKQFVIKKMAQNKYYGIMSNGNTVNDVVLGIDKDFKYAHK